MVSTFFSWFDIPFLLLEWWSFSTSSCPPTSNNLFSCSRVLTAFVVSGVKELWLSGWKGAYNSWVGKLHSWILPNMKFKQKKKEQWIITLTTPPFGWCQVRFSTFVFYSVAGEWSWSGAVQWYQNKTTSWQVLYILENRMEKTISTTGLQLQLQCELLLISAHYYAT